MKKILFCAVCGILFSSCYTYYDYAVSLTNEDDLPEFLEQKIKIDFKIHRSRGMASGFEVSIKNNTDYGIVINWRDSYFYFEDRKIPLYLTSDSSLGVSLDNSDSLAPSDLLVRDVYPRGSRAKPEPIQVAVFRLVIVYTPIVFKEEPEEEIPKEEVKTAKQRLDAFFAMDRRASLPSKTIDLTFTVTGEI
jgi:hypothetical protein